MLSILGQYNSSLTTNNTHFNDLLLGVKYSAPLVLTISTHGAKHPHDVCYALIRQWIMDKKGRNRDCHMMW